MIRFTPILLLAVMGWLLPGQAHAVLTHGIPAGGGSQQVYSLSDGTLLGLWGIYGSGSIVGLNVTDSDLDGLFNQTPVAYYYGPLYGTGAWVTGGAEFDLFTSDTVAVANSDGTKLWDSIWVRWEGGNLQSVAPNGGVHTMGTNATRTGEPDLPPLNQTPDAPPVPEPMTAGLVGLGFAGLLFRRRRQA